MNEITHIHLGRQPFTISVEAHALLKAYLAEIKKQIGNDAEVLEEIESRMAELLAEHGVHDKKVILSKDVEFLKQQLGDPGDFKEEAPAATASDPSAKRFFRDTEHGLIAGVAAGLEAYVGVPAIVFRLLFILLTFSGGFGAVLYVLLWLLVPEAKTPSDRLQMQGKPVTVDNIKHAIEQADMPAAGRRAGRVLGKIVRIIARVICGIIGVGLIVAATALLCGIITGTIYTWVHGGQVSGQTIFPIGTTETTVLLLGALAGAVLSTLLLVIGVALVSMKWRLPAWLTAALLGLFIASAGVGAGLAADIAPRVHDRFNALRHSRTINEAPFTSVELTGSDVNYTFQPDTRYYFEVNYIGNPNDKLPTTNKNGALTIDTSAIGNEQLCTFFCFYNGHDLHVVIHAPKLDAVTIHGSESLFKTAAPFKQTDMSITFDRDSLLDLHYVNPQSAWLQVPTENAPRQLELKGLQAAYESDGISATDDGTLQISRTGAFELDTDVRCDLSQPLVSLLSQPDTIKVNGKIMNGSNFSGLSQDPDTSPADCLIVR